MDSVRLGGALYAHAKTGHFRLEERIMNRFRWLLLAIFVPSSPLAITGCAFLDKKETVVAIHEVPPKVRTAIENVTAGSTIKSIERIEQRGKVTYEVEYAK